jgi:hypothetical protein
MESGTTILTQGAYAASVLDRYRMTDCKESATPIAVGARFEKRPAEEKFPNAAAIGSLMYLDFGTRPDIAQAVAKMAKFTSNFGPEHVKGVKRILRYIKATLDAGIRYMKGRGGIIAYADSDYAGDEQDRRSTSGYIIYIWRTSQLGK